MRSSFVFVATASLALAACHERDAPPSESPTTSDGAPAVSTGDAGGDGDDGEPLAVGESNGKQLPLELVAELRLSGDDGDGRLLTLAPGFIATAACSDCGAPTYLWFLAVRCQDTTHCDVLTEICEGTIARDGDRFALEFHAVESNAETDASCNGYTGSFERP